MCAMTIEAGALAGMICPDQTIIAYLVVLPDEAPPIAAGRQVNPGVRAMVLPGSGSVKRAAEAEGRTHLVSPAMAAAAAIAGHFADVRGLEPAELGARAGGR